MILKVYTDGACSNNGKENAKAGFGVYFGENDSRNISKRVIGKQTNNVAELSAIIEVFSILKDEIKMYEKIIIYSDSKIAIGWCTTTGEKYAKRNWGQTQTGKPKRGRKIPNVNLIKSAYELMLNNLNVSLEYIKAHTGLIDENSLGNEGADRLANLSIGLKSCPYIKEKEKEKEKEKYYLNIPYSEKEIGKKYGTKWDPKKKKWYYEGSNNDKNFIQLIQLFPI